MENNILIAEFMGASVEVWEAHKRLDDDVTEDAWYAYFDGNGVAVEELDYNTSWDWLMPVVQKCYKIDNHEAFNNLVDAVAILDIDATYQAVIEFINYYNRENGNL